MGNRCRLRKVICDDIKLLYTKKTIYEPTRPRVICADLGRPSAMSSKHLTQNTTHKPTRPRSTVGSDGAYMAEENNRSHTSNISLPSQADQIRDFYIGLGLAIGSSLFIGSSFIFKKLGLLKLARNQSTRAGQGGYGYLKEWLWWAGMILMITGEFANFAAYAFAPATMVTPLGALSVLVSAILSSRFLKEKLNLLGKVGCFMCVIGSTVMVLNSPQEQEVESMKVLLQKIEEPIFIIFAISLVAVAVFFIFFMVPRYGQQSALIYIVICSTLGAFTVMGCKGVGVALKETFHGYNQFKNWLTWLLLFVVVSCILVQMNYLNRALDTFNTAVVTPIYYVFFTSCVILMSVVLYKEWNTMTGKEITGDLCGFLTICTGIFLLQAFRDMDVSLANLPKARRGTDLNGEAIQGLLDDDSTDLTQPLSKGFKDTYDDQTSESEMHRVIVT
ncbi:hypothetical protein FSP39_005322 [Pinctada imbricata]|uniref:Magnesium transporter NIPA2 n=1 Tax=Pinctada imbricata TaxID=66713 RepID=A0AA88YCK0_PINIB|nr:hypothetical protein FSP39_005322 [Pinctada imbricata]